MKTTEKNTAKKFNLYTKQDLPAIYTQPQILNGSTFDYSNKVNNAKMDLPSEILLKFNPILLFEAREQKRNNSNETELYYIENSYTCFYSPNGNICLLRYDLRGKKYHFTPYYSYFREIQNVDFYRREEIQKKLSIEPKEPNHIGVFNEKKINEWLEYCDNLIETNKKIVEFSTNKNEEIKKEIEDFILSCGGEVAKWGENTEVKTKHFRVIFTHHQKSQYLSNKIEFSGTLEDVIKLNKIIN